MEFKKLNAPSLKELFVSELQNMILSGKLEIGAKLPPERELANSMHVSRAVVNAGISELEKMGFLVVKPRIGTFVEDYRKNGTLDTLVAIMNYNGGMLRDVEVKSILEVRIIFMSLAASMTIDGASDAEIASLQPYITQLKHSNDVAETAQLIYDFSHQIAFISGNTLLPLFFVSFKDLVIQLWTNYGRMYGIEELASSAEKIYQYICKRDKAGVVAYIEDSTNESIYGSRTIYNR